MASSESVGARKKDLPSPCMLCKMEFKKNTELRAHLIVEHGRTYPTRQGKTTEFSGEYRDSSDSDREWAKNVLGHRGTGGSRGKCTPYTPRSSAFSPTWPGSRAASPALSLLSGMDTGRRISMDLAPDETTDRMVSEIASLRRHAVASRPKKDGRAAGSADYLGSPSAFRTPGKREAASTMTREVAEERERQAKARREIAKASVKDSPFSEREQSAQRKANYLGDQLMTVTAEVGRELAPGSNWIDDVTLDELSSVATLRDVQP